VSDCEKGQFLLNGKCEDITEKAYHQGLCGGEIVVRVFRRAAINPASPLRPEPLRRVKGAELAVLLPALNVAMKKAKPHLASFQAAKAAKKGTKAYASKSAKKKK
jgi:hypothetical protein